MANFFNTDLKLFEDHLSWFYDNCPQGKLPPTLTQTLTQSLTLTGGGGRGFPSGAIVRTPFTLYQVPETGPFKEKLFVSK